MPERFPRTLTVICQGRPRGGAQQHPALAPLPEHDVRFLEQRRRTLYRAGDMPDRIFHSHHAAAHDAARAFGGARRVVEDPRLGEVGIGELALKPHSWLDRHDLATEQGAAIVEIWNGLPYDVRPKGGESFLDAEQRIMLFLHMLRERCADYDVVVLMPPMLMILFDRILRGRTTREAIEELERGLPAAGSMRRYAASASRPSEVDLMLDARMHEGETG